MRTAGEAMRGVSFHKKRGPTLLGSSLPAMAGPAHGLPPVSLAEESSRRENATGSNKDGEVHSLPARNQENVKVKRVALELLPSLARLQNIRRCDVSILPSPGGSLPQDARE